jgi:RNA polymerase sigma-70 factor (ECF subfamily)
MSRVAPNITTLDVAKTWSDENLLASIAASDGPADRFSSRSAMHILYDRHHLRIYRFIMRMVRDAPLAEDIVSQVFLDVWRSARRFRGGSQVSTWLLSIARFKALTALRQRRHKDIDQDGLLEIADGAATPEAALERDNTVAILRYCIARLSPAHREIIDLVYYHEKSVQEAGAFIGIPQSTVKTRMFYARKQLADLLRSAGVNSLAA